MKAAILTLLLLTSACATTDSTWVKDVDSNQLTISSGRTKEARFVSISNNQRTWNGSLLGEEEKVQARKDFLVGLSEEEAGKICKDDGYTKIEDPSFNMQDVSPEAYGGGLLGVLIAEAASSYKNIPISSYYRFKCKNEMSSTGELEVRK
jgi:hypothetical protein